MEDGTHTELRAVTSGVPQGSVLAPLLFSIFIADLPTCLLTSRYIIYTDDTQIISHGLPANIHDLLRDVARDANAVCEWATINGLTCNAAKTKVMLIGSLSFVTSLKPLLPAGLNIDGEIVPFSEEIKTLGVFLSEKFNWDRQIAFMTSKVHHSLYALRFYKHALSRKMRLMLVGALVAPHLDYPAPLLTDLTKKQTLALQRLQNACIRFIYGTIPRTAHVTPYRLALGWLSAEGRREVINCSLASRIIRNASPGYLRKGFRVIGVPTETEEIRQSARRRPPVLYYKAPRTASLDRSFAFSSAIAINNLPFITNILSPPPRFKSLHTSFLMQHEKAEWLQRCRTESLAPVPPGLTQVLNLNSAIPKIARWNIHLCLLNPGVGVGYNIGHPRCATRQQSPCCQSFIYAYEQK
uniref:Reverse transcriptase domain-containing protein n=1 Tax=Trichogramma kaykai TaxID=54128 RepID=A0ABD2XDA2_9HYME